MDSKAQIEAMARKYKEEMLRMYKQSGRTGRGTAENISPPRNVQPPRAEVVSLPKQALRTEVSPPKIESAVSPDTALREPSFSQNNAPAEKLMQENLPAKAVNTMSTAQAETSEKALPKMDGQPKFPSPEEIMREEFGEALESRFDRLVEPNLNRDGESEVPSDEKTPRADDDTAPENFQGNYNSKEFSDISDPLEPRYNETAGENASPDESGTGYIKAEVTTGGGAVPIENAVVLITKKENGRTYLLKMLISDESGSTETVALPAPNVSFSETPDPSEKPFADYYISAYADGFYAENDMEVPVFSGVKSIQPVALIPKASDDSRFMLN